MSLLLTYEAFFCGTNPLTYEVRRGNPVALVVWDANLVSVFPGNSWRQCWLCCLLDLTIYWRHNGWEYYLKSCVIRWLINWFHHPKHKLFGRSLNESTDLAVVLRGENIRSYVGNCFTWKKAMSTYDELGSFRLQKWSKRSTRFDHDHYTS